MKKDLADKDGGKCEYDQGVREAGGHLSSTYEVWKLTHDHYVSDGIESEVFIDDRVPFYPNIKRYECRNCTNSSA